MTREEEHQFAVALTKLTEQVVMLNTRFNKLETKLDRVYPYEDMKPLCRDNLSHIFECVKNDFVTKDEFRPLAEAAAWIQKSIVIGLLGAIGTVMIAVFRITF